MEEADGTRDVNQGYTSELTLVNRDVCAVTAQKGVCSGSGASMLGRDKACQPGEMMRRAFLE